MSRVLAVVEKVLIRAKASSDVVLAIVMAMIIGAMIVPLPSWMLDLGWPSTWPRRFRCWLPRSTPSTRSRWPPSPPSCSSPPCFAWP